MRFGVTESESTEPLLLHTAQCLDFPGRLIEETWFPLYLHKHIITHDPERCENEGFPLGQHNTDIR